MPTTLRSDLVANISSTPTTLHENFLKHVTTVEIVISLVYFTIISIAIVTGNTLVIAAFVKNFRLQTKTNTFILGLAVADFLVGVISIPGWLYVYSCHYFDIILHPVVYDLYITYDVFIGCASIFQLTSISIERCIAIVWPIRHRGIRVGVFHKMIIVAWIASAFVAGLYPVQLKHWEEGYTAFIFSICFAGPFIVLFGVYVLIYDRARNSRTRVCSEIASVNFRREIRVTGTVALVTGVFLIAWFPFFVVTALATYEMERLPEPAGLLRLIAFVKALHYSNSGLNPIIYGYRNPEMGRTMKTIAAKFFPCFSFCRRRPGLQPTRLSRSGNSSTLPPQTLTVPTQFEGRSSATPIAPSVTSVVAFVNSCGEVEVRPVSAAE